MIVHGATEIAALADMCEPCNESSRSGWMIDECHFSEDHVKALQRAYVAVLKADIDPFVVQELEKYGVPINDLLMADDDSRELVTRSDAVEIAAIAALIKIDEWPVDTLIAPNIPKMSRKKSDSGIDVMAVIIDPDLVSDSPLSRDEVLYLCSVKHTLSADSGNLRYDLLKSVSDAELSRVYMAAQLRVFKGRLESEGHRNASRVFYFMEDFPNGGNVQIHATAGVDTTLLPDFIAQLDRHLKDPEGDLYYLRTLVIPDLKNLHVGCHR